MPINSSPSLNLFGTRKTKQQQNSEAILNSHPDDKGLSLPERKLLNQMDSYEGMTVVWSSFLWGSILCICVQTEKAILQFQPPRVLRETTLGREGQGIPVWWGRKVLRRRLVRIRKQHHSNQYAISAIYKQSSVVFFFKTVQIGRVSKARIQHKTNTDKHTYTA